MPRQFRIVYGRQRSGKSALLAELARAYAARGRWAFAYNLRLSDDFAGADLIELGTVEEATEAALATGGKAGKRRAQAIRRTLTVDHWRDVDGLTYRWADWNARVWGRFVKAHPLARRDERAFVRAFWRYAGGGLLIWDDARRSFSEGMGPELEEFVTRINHSGTHSAWAASRGRGVDVCLVFHGADQVNRNLYDACTHLTVFRTLSAPEGKNVRNEATLAALRRAYYTLKTAPNYWRCDIDLLAADGVCGAISDDRGKQRETWII